MILVHLSRPQRHTVTAVVLADVHFDFVAGTRHGNRASFAILADDHASAVAIREKIARMPGHYVVLANDDDSVVCEDPGFKARLQALVSKSEALVRVDPIVVDGPVVEVSDDDGLEASVRRAIDSAIADGHPMGPFLDAAIRNGWRAIDLKDTGEGNDAGRIGGLSRTTGLSLGEMSISSPPLAWAEMAVDHYPWECLGFDQPGMDWTPPLAPAKPKRAEDDPTRFTSAISDSPAPAGFEVPKFTDEEIASFPAATLTPVAPAPIVPAEDVDDDPEPAPVDGAPDPLDGWDAKTIREARGVVNELKTANDGKKPNVQKANYHLLKLDLPKVNAAQLAALLGS